MSSLGTIGHLIDGEVVPSADDRTFVSIEPGTGQELATVALGSETDVDRAVSSAWKAYRSGVWVDLSPGERARRLRRLAGLVERDGDRLAELESRDSGAPISKTRGDVASTVGLIEYFSQLPEHVAGRTYATDPGYLVYTTRDPYGVVGAIAPWNFPLVLAAWKTIPALAVGNSVVLKMAEQTPVTTSEFGLLCLEAGIPPGVVNVVHGDGPTTGAALVRHPGVPKLTFTGSTDVGREILRSAADHIKSVHLELGGKTPSIVFADGDLDQALEGSLFTSFFNSGQVCTSGSRILVQEDVIDDFRDAFVARAAGLATGDPMSDDTQLGPLVSREQQERVLAYIRAGQQEGATLVSGGEVPPEGASSDGYFVSPTVFANVTQDMRIAREEIFGPVATFIPFKDEAEAISIANDVAYGLAATVWTQSLGRAMRVFEGLEAGTVWTNCPNHGQWNAPYEGHKLSGLGEDKGLECIETFTRLKGHHVNFGTYRQSWA